MINKNSKIKNKIYIFGNLENKSKKWLSKKIKKKFIHKKLPFGEVRLIIESIKKFEIKKKFNNFFNSPNTKARIDCKLYYKEKS